MPWTRMMLRDWFGWDEHKASRYTIEMAAKGRIACLEPGVYTAKSRVPLVPPPISYRGVTFSPREHGDVITDDMLARFGFNL